MAYLRGAFCTPSRVRRSRNGGFTLIELSIVLVIIGLIIGGVLVGQDLINSAATRAQITQIEKYNSAVNTFKNKYGGIPGDLSLTDATNFGFNISVCNGGPGERDGNGLIDGYPGISLLQSEGETALFWSDISTANLIDAQISGGERCGGVNIATTTTPGATYIGNFFPTAKIGYGNFIYVYETGVNWYGLSAITSTLANGGMYSNPTIPVTQAYNIDKKIDDGIPTTGNVQAVYLTNWLVSAAPSGNPDTASTCYNSSTPTYSTNISNGSGPNCALSFKMQGAAR